MNTETENYLIGTLFIGILLNYLLLKTPNIIYKGNNSTRKMFDSKCFNSNSQEIVCNKNI